MAASAAAATAADPAAAGRVDKVSAAQEQRRQQLQAGAAHEYLLVEFALTLLHGCASCGAARARVAQPTTSSTMSWRKR